MICYDTIIFDLIRYGSMIFDFGSIEDIFDEPDRLEMLSHTSPAGSGCLRLHGPLSLARIR